MRPPSADDTVRAMPSGSFATLVLALVVAAGARPARGADAPAAPGAAARQDADPARAARAAWSAGQRREALTRAEAALAADPSDDGLRSDAVAWSIALHRYHAAWEHLTRLGREHDPARGQVLYLLGRYEEALAFLGGSRPEDALARVDALEALGRATEARAALEDAARVLGPEDPRIRSWRGRMLAREGRHADALPELRAALAADPLDQAARFGLGRSLVALGGRAEGLAVLEEHRRLAPLVDELDLARRSLDLEPASAGNHAALGDCERALGRTERAREAYLAAERLADPGEFAPIVLRRARLVREDGGDLPGAIAVLERALERERDPRLLVRLGDYLVEAERPADALARFDEALALLPDDPAITGRRRDAAERAEAGR
jgi:tetratricopeptide (TPR) repeat protein